MVAEKPRIGVLEPPNCTPPGRICLKPIDRILVSRPRQYASTRMRREPRRCKRALQSATIAAEPQT